MESGPEVVLAFEIASRKEPAPLSLVLVTVNTAVYAWSAAQKRNAATRSNSRLAFKGFEIEANIVNTRANNCKSIITVQAAESFSIRASHAGVLARGRNQCQIAD